jgi:CRP/FNR family transcriptional regulator, cyclic AMP receptor protein
MGGKTAGRDRWLVGMRWRRVRTPRLRRRNEALDLRARERVRPKGDTAEQFKVRALAHECWPADINDFCGLFHR